MVGSRLRQRRTNTAVDVISKTLSPSYAETNAYTALPATREQRDAFELMTDSGAVVMVTDVFWFEPTSGSLPVITEAHVLSDGTSRYEVLQVLRYDSLTQRLRVMTRRAR